LSLPDPSTILPGLPPGAEVLVLRLRSLGDVVMLTPALEAVHHWRPDLRLCVMVEPAFAPVLEGNPAVSETLLLESFFRSARQLRRRKFPVTFNHHAGPTSAWLTLAAGSPARVTWADRPYPFFYNVRVPAAQHFFGDRPVHTVEHRMTQFYFAGLPRGPVSPAHVYPRAAAAASVRLNLIRCEITSQTPYAVLHPGAAYFTKRWAVQHFVDLGRWLEARHGIYPVFVLGPGDREIGAALRHAAGTQTAILDSLSLSELIALIAGAALFAGNDSGPAHLAAAAGRPTVVIFGSSDSVTWRPWQTPHRIVQNDFPCNPCRGNRCYAFAEPRCILSVTLDQVKDACQALLDERKQWHKSELRILS